MSGANRKWIGIGLFVIGCAWLGASLLPRISSAQQSAAQIVVSPKLVESQLVTLTVPSGSGEPRDVKATAKFSRKVDAYWISVVGVDFKFGGTIEKPINRQFFRVDPLARTSNGMELEITGTVGARDGSGDWDDRYEGTISVLVTAVLSPQ